MALATVEAWFRYIGGAAGLATLALAVWGMQRADARPAGLETGIAHRWVRWPVLALATVLFVAAGILLWRPLPLDLADWQRAVALVLGSALYFPGLGLYVWGYRTLGPMFGPSSGFGVRLYAGHRLVTSGPFRHVRHPMYLGVILAGWGGLLVFQTWTMALFAVIMLGLIYRGRREEEALAQEFGTEWAAYVRRVPGWMPRLRRAPAEDG